MAGSTATTASPFLSLPVELRLLIYAEAILDCRIITIGTAELKGREPDIVHRLYGQNRSPALGIPHHHEPVIATKYDASLLSQTAPAQIKLTPDSLDPPAEAYDFTRSAYHTLLQLCRQVKNELSHHFPIPSRRQTTLFVSYPFGLHILHTVTPQLLRQSKSVHVAGVYEPTDFSPARAARMGPRKSSTKLKVTGDVAPDSKLQLDDLVKSMFGPDPVNPVEKLELRIYYPGDDSYSTVWGDDSSPVVVALRNIHLGEASIEVWRGTHATGVYITVRPTTEKKRVVSTVWRRLEEGRHGQPKDGSWIVDSTWPNWNADSEEEGLKGDVIISRSVS